MQLKDAESYICVFLSESSLCQSNWLHTLVLYNISRVMAVQPLVFVGMEMDANELFTPPKMSFSNEAVVSNTLAFYKVNCKTSVK